MEQVPASIWNDYFAGPVWPRIVPIPQVPQILPENNSKWLGHLQDDFHRPNLHSVAAAIRRGRKFSFCAHEWPWLGDLNSRRQFTAPEARALEMIEVDSFARAGTAQRVRTLIS
jgi:hypothetical protein